MTDLHTLFAHMNGIARGVDLAEYGWSRKRLKTAVDSGQILRLRPGVFASHLASPYIVTAARHGGAVTCAKALRLMGVWVIDRHESETHVWMGTGHRPHQHRECTCKVHHARGSLALGVAPLETALIQTQKCHGHEVFFAAFESAWRQGLLSESARIRIRTALPASAKWLIDFARSDADSGLESLIRLRLHLLGFDAETQVTIPTVGRVDLVVVGRVIIEADGEENHGSEEKRARDLRRDANASKLGYETLRFTYSMIVYEWALVADAILAAVGRAR